MATRSEATFGGRPIGGTADDILWLLEEALGAGGPMPALYVACGAGDPLIEHNRRFVAAAEGRVPSLTTDFGPGEHDWAYWIDGSRTCSPGCRCAVQTLDDGNRRPMTSADEPAQVSADFVFGTLATDELRLAQLRAAAAGVHHGHDLEPLDPDPGEPITVRVTLGPAVDAVHVTAYYTTDGRDPTGSHGIAETGDAVQLARTGVTWDTLAWAYREAWAGSIPGQPDGTSIRYRIEAWSERSAESAWASEIAGVTTGERPAGVTDEDARLFAYAGELWPVRRRASYAVSVDRERLPDWLRDAVLYQVFVDGFATTGGIPFATPATPGGF